MTLKKHELSIVK